jgi:hypothetical protein
LFKQCTKCLIEKPLTEFYNRNAKVFDGKNSHCKACERLQIDKWRIKNKEKQAVINRRTRLKNTYGITLEQYDELFEKQKGCCAICNRHQSVFKVRLAIDHAHTGPNAGAIRGLLCNFCNHRLVGKHVDGDLLRRMADYVESSTGWFVPLDKVNIKKKRAKRKKRLAKTDNGSIDVSKGSSV